MEVGAVKQAFNNEVILLKKKLNQAKIHVIHKLTRKAKTLTEKKAPDHLKEKLKRKAESAVNEVLIIKKIKARDIAKFIITHTGQVGEYLNRPKVDNEKACARLVLHKSLQDKYKFIRNRFGNIPIKDLFMSRQERRKLKKEAKEQQNNKKKGKKAGEVTNSAGDWDVEDLEMGEGGDVTKTDIGSEDEISGDESDQIEENKITRLGNENDSAQDESESGDEETMENDEESGKSDEDTMEKDEESVKSGEETMEDKHESDDGSENDSNSHESEDEQISKLTNIKNDKVKPVQKSDSFKRGIEPSSTHIVQNKQIKVKKNKSDKKVKENKNKNLKEKLQNRKFKKDDDDTHISGRKVVDPFFITATGENYLSLAEPRQPDEVKEVHKQGNRQERRAAMFGRKFKPRNDFRGNNFRNKFDEGNDNRNSGGRSKHDRFSNSKDFDDRNSKFNDINNKFNDRNTKFNDTSKFNDKNNRLNSKYEHNNRNDNKKEEKLHPSWEAKRKLKSMKLLPSQGKKIVFDDN